VRLLQNPDARPCRNARTAFAQLVAGWGAEDPRTANVFDRLAQAFADLSPAGQENSLRLGLDWFDAPERRSRSAPSIRAALIPLVAASADREEPVRAAALDLCAILLTQAGAEDVLVPARALVRSCLQADSASVRARAATLALVDGMEVVEHVVPLLQDPA